jgi:hypothetical protein
MWRHTPKIVVLAAIGVLMLIFYVTQSDAPAPPAPPPAGGKGPGVVYINPGFGSGGR